MTEVASRAAQASTEPLFTVVICTRNRSKQLGDTLAALDRQTFQQFDVLVVDQSDEDDQALAERARVDPRMRILRSGERGVSRARNAGWQRAETPWLVYLDDDCIPEEAWAEELQQAIEQNPDVWFVGTHVDAGHVSSDDYVVVSAHRVEEERRLAGRWQRPWDIGFTVMAIPRQVLEALGGFDERLGPGAADFPCADDMDFNYRLLRAGGIAYLTPRVRSRHDQWRSETQLVPHFRRYMVGWCGFAMKHLRSGDLAGGVWLWHWALRDALRMLASAVRRRSRLRLRIAAGKFHGIALGTWKGVTRRW